MTDPKSLLATQSDSAQDLAMSELPTENSRLSSLKANDIPTGVLLQVAGRVAAEALDRTGRDFGVSGGHLSLLGMIVRFPGLPQSSYGAILVLNDATLGRYAMRLEEKGLVERHRGDQDSRTVMLTPTQEGLAVFKELRQRLTSVASEFRDGMPAGRYEELFELLAEFLHSRNWTLPG
ncbi:MarR family winged helix-turn-helix transcriptional regulator [Lutimaribacter marinistellae]|uniref:MarR family winged helix-turn-helix transcriptional regulator n=1 Tax=Lutimaribacter marinistellae TaxID=1820329 RepID=A0ABV7TK50_9RHOB